MEEKIISLLQAIEENTLLSAKEMLTTQDVMRLTGISETHLRNMRMRREIPYYKRTNKLVYYDRNEIMEWMRANRVATVEESGVRASIRKMKGGNNG